MVVVRARKTKLRGDDDMMQQNQEVSKTKECTSRPNFCSELLRHCFWSPIASASKLNNRNPKITYYYTHLSATYTLVTCNYLLSRSQLYNTVKTLISNPTFFYMYSKPRIVKKLGVHIKTQLFYDRYENTLVCLKERSIFAEKLMIFQLF